MKKGKLFLPVFFIILMLAGMIPGKAFAADSIINTVSLHYGMREIHLNPAFTEYQVSTKLYKRCGVYSDGAYLDTGNVFLGYWNETYNSIYGTGDGSNQVNETKQYYIIYTLGCEVGYDWPEELKKVNTKDVPISDFPSFKVYVNGRICKDAYTKCNPVHNLLQIVVPIANDISDGSTSLSKNTFTYDGKEKKPEIQSVVLSDGTKLTSKNCTVSFLDASGTTVTPKAAGKYQAVIEGRGIYTGSLRRSFTIKKAANPITVKGKTVTAKAATLAKKNLTWKPSKSMTIKNAQGKLSYKLVSVTNSKYKKYFTVNNKTGVITAKKGLKKGTYKLKIAVTAAGNSNYNAVIKNLTTTVKVA